MTDQPSSHLSRRSALTAGGAAMLSIGALAGQPHVAAAASPQASARAEEMVVTLLGTGSPVLSPTRFGCSVLVQAAGLNLVFDAGRGCPVRLAQLGVPLGKVNGTFLTHFHSDHVNGLPDLWMSSYIPALGGREGEFQLYGPVGVKHIADGLVSTFQNDINVRVADGEVRRDTTGITAHEYSGDKVVFNQSGVKVTMFKVQHDPRDVIKPAVGYRIDHGRSSVLISGDTRPHPNVVKYGRGVDLLIHEVADFPDPTLQVVQAVYAHHTNPRQAGEIFAKTKPVMAAYTHIVRGAPPQIPNVPLDVIVQRTRQTYRGPLTVGEDLTRFIIRDREVTVVPLYAEPQ